MSEKQKRKVAAKGGAWSDLFGGEVMVKQPKKIEKAAKATSGMFKNLLDLIPGIDPIMKIMETFDAFLILLKPFELILKIINALLSVMAAEIIKPLFEALKPLYTSLMSLTPVFASIGKTIGELIATLLTPDFIITLMNLVLSIANLASVILTPDFIKGIINLIAGFITLMEVIITGPVKTFIDWVGTLNPSEIARLFYIIGLGLATILGAMTGGWVGMLIAAAAWAIGMSGLLALQAGGIITSPTLGVIGEAGPEAIIPLSKLNEFMKTSPYDDDQLIDMYYEQKETNRLLRKVIRDKRII